MAVKADDQLAMDDKTIDDETVEAALEERQKAKDELDDVRRHYDDAHDKAKSAIQRLELPEEGGAVRAGRFRITKRVVKGGLRSFETKDRTQLSIALLDED